MHYSFNIYTSMWDTFFSFYTSQITWRALEFAIRVDINEDLKADAIAMLFDQDPQ